MQSRYLTTPAIILKKKPYSEYHQFISFFSPTLGLNDASVKGSRKIESRYTGHLEILNICELQLYQKQQHFTVVQCQTIQSNKLFQQSIEHSSLGWLMVEIINILGKSSNHSAEIYDLIIDTIKALETVQLLSLMARSFILKILHIHGFLIDLRHCSECGYSGNTDEFVFLQEQRLLCSPCIQQSSTANNHKVLKLTWGILKELEFLVSAPYKLLPSILTTPANEKMASQLINALIESTFEKKFVSEKLFAGGYL